MCISDDPQGNVKWKIEAAGEFFQLKCQLLENVESPIIIWMARKQWGCKGCSAQVPTTLTD